MLVAPSVLITVLACRLLNYSFCNCIIALLNMEKNEFQARYYLLAGTSSVIFLPNLILLYIQITKECYHHEGALMSDDFRRQNNDKQGVKVYSQVRCGASALLRDTWDC